MPSNFLRSLINSKTRISLLLRFYLNQNLRGYLQGLNNELGENKNSLRSKLNGLEKAGQLSEQTLMECKRGLALKLGISETRIKIVVEF